jgi:diguanylate cyclase (GGDEF)-like protein/PAS domain S-box-containing protein
MDKDDRPGTRAGSDKLNILENTGQDPESQIIHNKDQVQPEDYRSCLDAIPDLICLKGEELEYLFANRAFCTLLGKKQDQVLGRRSIDIFPKDTARKMETMDLLVLATSKKTEEEISINDRIYEIRKFPVNLQDKGLIVINGRDITERKEAEHTLLSEKIRFQILSDNAPTGMMLLDSEGSVKYLNTRFKDIFGYDTDDIADGDMWFRRSFPDRDFESDTSSILTRADEVRGWKNKEQLTLTAICRNGTQKIISMEAVQLISGDIVISCDDKLDRVKDDDNALYKVDFDSLTGLPNRLSMVRAIRIAVDHAAQALKRRSVAAALFIDIEDFEELSEKHGCLMTNEIIKSLGKQLKDVLRAGDNGYRCNTGQFGVIFKGISMAEAHLAAERILKALKTIVFGIGEERVYINLALILIQIDGKKEPLELFSSALKTLEKVKALGHNQIAVVES